MTILCRGYNSNLGQITSFRSQHSKIENNIFARMSIKEVDHRDITISYTLLLFTVYKNVI